MGQELLDRDGRVLGFFMTEAEYQSLMLLRARYEFDQLDAVNPPVTDVATLKTEDGFTTAQVLDLLSQWKTTPPVAN